MASSKRLVRVLLTGGGKFKQEDKEVPVNPSHSLALALDGTVMETKDCIVVLTAYGPPIEVIYRFAEDHIPRLHDFGWDLVVHMGICLTDEFLLETLAHGTGYKTLPDMCDRLPPDGQAKVPLEPVPDVLYSKLPLEEIATALQPHAQPFPIKVAHDPGHYLCDYTFYLSLAEAIHRNSGRLVQFLHIPTTPPYGDHKPTEEQPWPPSYDFGAVVETARAIFRECAVQATQASQT